MKKALLTLIFCLAPITAYAHGEIVVDGGVDIQVFKRSVLFYERTSDPSSPSSNGIKLYAKDNGGTTTLYTKDSAGTVTEVGAGAGGGHTIQNEGSDLAARTYLNFTGAGVDCVDDSGNDQTDCTITSGGGSGTMTTVKENGTQLGGADIVTIDFLGADFDLTESPDTEVNIVIAAALTRDAEWDTTTEINAATTDDDFATLTGSQTLTNKTLAAANNVIDADTAVALAADPTDCSAGSFTIGVNASGTAQGCTDAWTEAENTAAAYLDQTEADALYLLLTGGTLTGELKIDETGIEGQPTDALTDCSTFAATGGGIFYDDSEGQWKKCEDNVLSDLDTGGAETNSLEVITTGIASTEIPIGTAANTVVYAALSGDVTMTNGGVVSIGNDKVTEADLKAVDAASDEECLTYETTTGDFEWQTCGSGSDTNAVKEYWWPASATLPLEAADSIPPISKDAGTNIDQLTVDFDDSTDECRTVSFKVPSDIDTSATVTFRAHWYSAAATTGDIMLDFRHNSGVGDGVDPDAALTTEADAADTTAGTAGQLNVSTWTETVSNLSWAANDQVDAVFCRDANNGSDTLAGDAKMTGFGVEIPRA